MVFISKNRIAFYRISKKYVRKGVDICAYKEI